jgi:hypothetical protein
MFFFCFGFFVAIFMHKNLLGAKLLVRAAGENLASSAPESVSEECEQCALGLQKIASNRQLARQSEVVF